jgi:hypothetical protein
LAEQAGASWLGAGRVGLGGGFVLHHPQSSLSTSAAPFSFTLFWTGMLAFSLARFENTP